MSFFRFKSVKLFLLAIFFLTVASTRAETQPASCQAMDRFLQSWSSSTSDDQFFSANQFWVSPLLEWRLRLKITSDGRKKINYTKVNNCKWLAGLRGETQQQLIVDDLEKQITWGQKTFSFQTEILNDSDILILQFPRKLTGLMGTKVPFLFSVLENNLWAQSGSRYNFDFDNSHLQNLRFKKSVPKPPKERAPCQIDKRVELINQLSTQEKRSWSHLISAGMQEKLRAEESCKNLGYGCEKISEANTPSSQKGLDLSSIETTKKNLISMFSMGMSMERLLRACGLQLKGSLFNIKGGVVDCKFKLDDEPSSPSATPSFRVSQETLEAAICQLNLPKNSDPWANMREPSAQHAPPVPAKKPNSR